MRHSMVEQSPGLLGLNGAGNGGEAGDGRDWLASRCLRGLMMPQLSSSKRFSIVASRCGGIVSFRGLWGLLKRTTP